MLHCEEQADTWAALKRGYSGCYEQARALAALIKHVMGGSKPERDLTSCLVDASGDGDEFMSALLL